MSSRVLNLQDVIVENQLGCSIADKFIEWDGFRQTKLRDWEEVNKYIYAIDTSKTSNSSLPWKNKTTIPKLCQIRDNLYANYMATMFPKRKWLKWEGEDQSSATLDKREAITDYISYCIDNPSFKDEVGKLVLDYIDYGNCFGTIDWEDGTVEVQDGTNRLQVGYVGPVIRRIDPLDIVFDPTAKEFTKTPKIIRSLVTLGDVKEMLERFSLADDDQESYQELWNYLDGVRTSVREWTGDMQYHNERYNVAGFHNFRNYLEGNTVEILTFFGDIYNEHTREFLKNHKIMVVDRHKIIYNKPNSSFFGYPPVFHVGWRKRQDNLWAMGPLDNLVGMQYRIDHIENLKADVFDLITFPPLKIKGYVEDFTWGPFEKIFVGDEGDVEMLVPPFQVLQADQEIAMYEAKMEEMAGAPKEAMGFRTPGEKTMYEVQRLENAASRIFTNKIAQFEEQFIEKLLNGMLELARRKMTSLSIRVFDNEYKLETFKQLTPEDITGNGRIRPIAARHFAEQAERVQNLTNFFASTLGVDPDIKAHFSSIKLAEMFEDLLDLSEYEIVMPFVRLTEQQQAQRLSQAGQEQAAMAAMTPAGLTPDDSDEAFPQ